jgi:transcriptional regulator with PAS, ATPase and Fis domain
MDEVGELNLSMQVKLLRAIEGGGYTPIGSSVVKQADIRIVAATNRNLKKAWKSGHFRKDFYYRIHILPITCRP